MKAIPFSPLCCNVTAAGLASGSGFVSDETVRFSEDDFDCSEEAMLLRVALDQGQARIVVGGVADSTAVGRIFSALAAADIGIDFVVQTEPTGEDYRIAFTLPAAERLRALAALAGPLAGRGAGHILSHNRIAKLSVVGIGVKTHGEIAAMLFEALAKIGINVEMIGTSEQVLSVIVDLTRAEAAFDAACEAFDFPADELDGREPSGI